MLNFNHNALNMIQTHHFLYLVNEQFKFNGNFAASFWIFIVERNRNAMASCKQTLQIFEYVEKKPFSHRLLGMLNATV